MVAVQVRVTSSARSRVRSEWVPRDQQIVPPWNDDFHEYEWVLEIHHCHRVSWNRLKTIRTWG